MAKKRALSIKAIVTQNSLDSDGNTVVTNKGTYYFTMELFLRNYMEKFLNIRYNEKSNPAGLKYMSFYCSYLSELLDRLSTIFNSPDTLEDKTLDYKSSDYTEISVTKYNKELFDDSYDGTSSSNYYVSDSLVINSANPFAQFVRYEFLSLSDEAYNKFVEVWKDKITKTLNSIFPDLVGEITLVFTNSATTEE